MSGGSPTKKITDIIKRISDYWIFKFIFKIFSWIFNLSLCAVFFLVPLAIAVSPIFQGENLGFLHYAQNLKLLLGIFIGSLVYIVLFISIKNMNHEKKNIDLFLIYGVALFILYANTFAFHNWLQNSHNSSMQSGNFNSKYIEYLTMITLLVSSAVFVPRAVMKNLVYDQVKSLNTEEIEKIKKEHRIDFINIHKIEAHDNRMNAFLLLELEHYSRGLGFAFKSVKGYVTYIREYMKICSQDSTYITYNRTFLLEEVCQNLIEQYLSKVILVDTKNNSSESKEASHDNNHVLLRQFKDYYDSYQCLIENKVYIEKETFRSIMSIYQRYEIVILYFIINDKRDNDDRVYADKISDSICDVSRNLYEKNLSKRLIEVLKHSDKILKHSDKMKEIVQNKRKEIVKTSELDNIHVDLKDNKLSILEYLDEIS